jgi:predicted nucleic acid-binding protein
VIVLDASVALAWCFTDESSPFADRVADHLRSDAALVPAIWPFEVSNALLAAERRGRLAEADRPRLTELLGALPIEIEGLTLAHGLGPVTDLAGPHGLSIYDGSYLELAHRLSLPLATLDRRLATVAGVLGTRLFE